MKFEQIIQLVEAVSVSTLTEFKYEENGEKISMKKTCGVMTVSAPQQEVIVSAASAAVQTEAAPAEAEVSAAPVSGKVVKSPLVGTFYAAPSEDAEPFVKAGDSVTSGQVVAIVEAMKLMNEIECEFSGVIEEVLVENGEAVEYGQPLFVVR